MPTYDGLIGVPVGGQPISTSAFGVPVRNAINDIDTRLAILEAAQLLPANVSAQGGGINTISAAANVWAVLPNFPVSVVMTNPSDVFNLVCNVFFGAWMQAAAGDVRMGFVLSGGLTVSPPTTGANQPIGWGLLPLTTQTTSDQHMGFAQVVIPAGASAVTFTGWGMRSNGTSNSQVNYPSINVVPDRFVAP